MVAVRSNSHPLYALLHDQPNQLQSSYDWRLSMQASVLLKGVGYSEIISDPGDGRILELRPLHADCVAPVRLSDGSIGFDVSDPGATGRRRLSAGDVFAVYDRCDDPCLPRSRISRARETIGTALSTNAHAANLYANSARPSGVLKLAGPLSEEGRQRLKESGNRRKGGPAMQGEPRSWKPASNGSRSLLVPRTLNSSRVRRFRPRKLRGSFAFPDLCSGI